MDEKEQKDKKRNPYFYYGIGLASAALMAAVLLLVTKVVPKQAQRMMDRLQGEVNAIDEGDDGEWASEDEKPRVAGVTWDELRADESIDMSNFYKPRDDAGAGDKDAAQDGADEMQMSAFWDTLTLAEKKAWYLDNYGIDIPEKNLNFDKLCADVNPDIYAWIYVPGTQVDYPVVQHPTDDSYYLDYNLDGSKGYPGGIYTEKTYNAKDFSDRMTVIYGHNMKTGQGFATLHDYGDSGFFEKNRNIFIYTKDDILVYEIFASYEADDGHILAGHDWDDTSWTEYLDDTLKREGEKDNALPDYDFKSGDKVLTLSTCIRNKPNNRYLVQGVLLR